MATGFGGPNYTYTIVEFSDSVSHDFWFQGTKTVDCEFRALVIAYRDNKFNDKTLHWCITPVNSKVPLKGSARVVFKPRSAMISEYYFLRDIRMNMRINDRYLFDYDGSWVTGNYQLPYFIDNSGQFISAYTGNTQGVFYTSNTEQKEENEDTLPSGSSHNDMLKKPFTSRVMYGAQVNDYGQVYNPPFEVSYEVWYASGDESGIEFNYPPYLPAGPDIDYSNNGSDSSNGKDISDPSGNTYLTISRTYSITKVGYNQTVSWSPKGTSGSYGLKISNECYVTNVGTGYSSPYTFTTPNLVGGSYSAYVKRFYTDYPEIQARSKRIYLYVYSKPTLTGISINKSNISPNSDASLTVTLNGMNNRTWSVENQFDTKIWSDFRGSSADPYYIDRTTSDYKTFNSGEIRALFPDSKASDGCTEGKIYTLRRNMGVSGGNPGSGTQLYETSTYSKTVKVQYKPKGSIDPNKEPNDNDPSSSGLVFFKNENRTQGAKLPKGKTWILPTDYNINNMTGVDVKIQYPKTDTSGVISGYKIQLLLPNDGTHSNDYVWYETYWYTDKYIYTGTISYNDLKRGISGNRIRITPFYIPNGVSQGSTGSYWYGPTIESKFVDIAWKLNKPVIDCPINGTTWHNHQYRILFKLPKDNDTNYRGTNDIEVHYGSGNYRYQDIEVKINGTTTTIGNNAYINAQNNWQGPTNVSGAKLNYLRAIVINPDLIDTYKDESVYKISIRVRKAYGQNTESFDGWSDWSNDITVNRKTVANDIVNRHEYIMATHYMTVQTAFNNSLACYAKTASDNKSFVIKESFNRASGDNINGPHLSPPQNTPLQTVKEYVSEFKDLHQLKNKINSYGTFDSGRNAVKLDSANKLLSSFTPSQEFITAAKDQEGATECNKPETILKGRNYMKYMCDELNNLK